MCFTKESAYKVAKEDIYLLKVAGMEVTNTFHSDTQAFIYRAGKIYRKNFGHRLVAFFSKYLEGTVFHLYSQKYSKQALPLTMQNRIGVFKIPKGTVYYESRAHVASFAVVYVGPYTKFSHLLGENAIPPAKIFE